MQEGAAQIGAAASAEPQSRRATAAAALSTSAPQGSETTRRECYLISPDIKVIRAETGLCYCVTMDPNADFEKSFLSMQVTIGTTIGVPECSQILLGTDGTEVNAETFRNYLEAGHTDIFLYDKSFPDHHFSPVSVFPNVPLLPSSHNLDRGSQLLFAKEVVKLVEERLIRCTERKTEIANQDRAVTAAIQSAHNYMKKVKEACSRTYAAAVQEKDLSISLLGSFQCDIDKIKTVPIPSFLFPLFQANLLGQVLQEEMLAKKRDKCVVIHEIFKKQIEEMESSVSDFSQATERLSLGSITNIPKLEENLEQLAEIHREVKCKCLSIEQDRDLQDCAPTTEFPAVEERPQHITEQLQHCEQTSAHLYQQLEKAKAATTSTTTSLLKSCALVGSLGIKASNNIRTVYHGIPAIRDAFTPLYRVHNIPSTFEAYITEIRTRNIFKARVRRECAKLSELLRQIREHEITRRREFRDKYLTLLPEQLQTGIRPELPLLEIMVPLFDSVLPNCEIEEDRLPPLVSDEKTCNTLREMEKMMKDWECRYATQEAALCILKGELIKSKGETEQERCHVNVLQQLVDSNAVTISQINSDLTEGNTQLIHMQEESETRSKEWEMKVQQKEATLRSREDTIKHQQAEIETLRKELEQRSSRLMLKEKDAQELERVLKNEKVNCMKLQQELELRKTREISSKESQEAECQKAQLIIRQLQKELVESNGKHQDLMEEIRKNTTLNNQLSETKVELQSELSQLRTELQVSKEREKRALAQAFEERQRVNQLLFEKGGMRAKNAELELSNEQRTKDLAQEKLKTEQIRQSLHEMQHQLETERKNLEAANKVISSRTPQEETNTFNLKSKLGTLEKELIETRKMLQNALEEKVVLRNQNAHLKEQLALELAEKVQRRRQVMESTVPAVGVEPDHLCFLFRTYIADHQVIQAVSPNSGYVYILSLFSETLFLHKEREFFTAVVVEILEPDPTDTVPPVGGKQVLRLNVRTL
ncbi:hypothetical protein Pelo_6488 [Pelomyxa schiedti]|nr:hypothetical protein Pelo_6488 [Pelomyxa schiedti]